MDELGGLETKMDDADGVEKVLSVVIKRRKTIPRRCLELDKQINKFELERLENSNILVEENKDREMFQKVVQELKKLKSFDYSIDDDLKKAEKKLEKHYNRALEINNFLKERKKI